MNNKTTCGKCWRIDNTKQICELYQVKLVILKPGRFPTYEKCIDCQDRIKPPREERPEGE